MSDLKIISLNTRGTKKKIEQIIKEIKPFNVILLQEQYLDKEDKIINKYKIQPNSKCFHTTDIQ